jgi:hypothetical protein
VAQLPEVPFTSSTAQPDGTAGGVAESKFSEKSVVNDWAYPGAVQAVTLATSAKFWVMFEPLGVTFAEPPS